MIRSLLNLILDICLLRRGPQDVPDADVLLKLGAALYVLVGVLTMMLSSVSLSLFAALSFALLDAMLLAGYTYLLLARRQLLGRFRQTLTALFGVGILISAVTLPLSIWFRNELLNQGNPQTPVLLTLALMIWNLVIIGHIFAEALGTRRGIGVLYAFGYLAAVAVLNSFLVVMPSAPA